MRPAGQREAAKDEPLADEVGKVEARCGKRRHSFLGNEFEARRRKFQHSFRRKPKKADPSTSLRSGRDDISFVANFRIRMPDTGRGWGGRLSGEDKKIFQGTFGWPLTFYA
jgi:hypothetical protein